jgi:hypothetical protein
MDAPPEERNGIFMDVAFCSGRRNAQDITLVSMVIGAVRRR